MSRRQAVIDLVRIVAETLGDDVGKFVFVGGAAVAMLTDNPRAGDMRPTDDVDIISDTVTYGQYADLVDWLRKQHGFQHDMNGPLCRFTVRGVTVDVMPTEEKILKFANRWYKHAIKSPVEYLLSPGMSVRVVCPAVLLCTKLEAFADRGRNDYLGSHDLEDIITLIDARDEIVEEIKQASEDVKRYVSDSFKSLLQQQNFLDSLEGLLPFGSGSRLADLKERLTRISAT